MQEERDVPECHGFVKRLGRAYGTYVAAAAQRSVRLALGIEDEGLEQAVNDNGVKVSRM